MTTATPKKSEPKKSVSKPKDVPKNLSSPLDDDPTVRVIHSGHCLSLSGAVTLGFDVGVRRKSDGSPSYLLRLTESTGKGFFLPRWVMVDEILNLFATTPADAPVSSATLAPLYAGSSVNTPPYLFAVLLHLGIVSAGEGEVVKYWKTERGVAIERLAALTSNSAN